MNETRTKVTVDDSGIESFFQRVKRDSEELGREMIQDARKYSTSSREVLKYIEEQISAIERRNRLDAEFGKAKLTRQYETGAITQEQFRERATELRRGTEEDKIQISLLREMIETIKQTAKEEIREDRKGVEEQIKQSKTVEQLAPEGDAEKILKETVQRGLLGDVKEGEFSDKARMASRTIFSGFGDFANAKNEIEGAISAGGTVGTAAAAGIGGFAGGLIGGIISSVTGVLRRGLEASERMESAKSGMIGITGRGMPEDWFDNIKNSANPFGMGLSYSEFLTGATEYGRANIGTIQRGSAVGGMRAEKAFGLDRGSLTGLARTQRGTSEDADMVTNVLLSTLNKTNKNENANRAYLGEYLSILTDVNRQQLQVLGRVDSGVNTKMIAALSKVGSAGANPEVLKQIIGSVYSGLTQAKTPQIEAMQYEVMSRIAPGASLWEMKKMISDPFGKKSQKYLPEFLKSLISISGSREDAYFNVQSVFGLSEQMTEDLINAYEKGDLNSFKKKLASPGYDLEKEAKKATGDLAIRSARYRAGFEKQGTKFFDMLAGSDEEEGYEGERNPEDDKKIKEENEKWARMSGSSDKTILEQNILIAKGIIEKYERDVAEGKSMTEEQNKFYQSELGLLEEIKGNLEQMNKQQRSWYTNVLKTSGAGQSIW